MRPEGPFEELLAGALMAQKLCLSGHGGHRKGLMDDKLPNRTMIEVQLTDALIRICDFAGALELDLGGAVAEKMAYNAVHAGHKPENRALADGKAY